MTAATAVDTDITAPPPTRSKTMKSNRFDDENYAKAKEFAKEDGSLEYVLNELLARYVANKEAQHAAKAAAAKRGKSKGKAAAEPEVDEPEYDPFA